MRKAIQEDHQKSSQNYKTKIDGAHFKMNGSHFNEWISFSEWTSF